MGNFLTDTFNYKHRTDFDEDENFISQLKQLAQFSYLDTSSLLDREIKHCKHIFYFENEDKELICFAMYNFEKLEESETVYYGLTVCADNYKSFGLAKKLWQKIAAETIKRQNETGTTFLCWLTTPTPIVFHWFNKFLQNAEPFLDGSYSGNGRKLAEKFQRIKYSQTLQQDTNPFVLRNVAANTLYSTGERQRVTEASKKLSVTAFENYNIDETNGDRFLIVGLTPLHSD